MAGNLLYPEGNWVELGQGAPFVVIGNSGHGRAILNRTLFHLEPAAYASFAALLDAPPQPNAKLARMLRTKAPWE